MKIKVFKDQLGSAPEQFLTRKAGYIMIHNRHTGKDSFARAITRNHYPRFHMYVMTEDDDKIILHLHLDQKEPSYEGVNAHSAEYEGEVVEGEIRRLINLITNN